MKKIFCGVCCLAILFSDAAFAKSVKEKKLKKSEEKSQQDPKYNKVITLKDAIIAAFNNNWAWKASGTDEKVAEEQLKQSQIAFFPSVDAFVNRSRTTGQGKALRDDLDWDQRKSGDITSIHDNSSNIGVRVTQNLFNGFQTVNQNKAAEFGAQAAHLKIAVAEEELVLQVISAYVGIWAAREKVKALRKKEQNLQKTLNSQNSSLEAGAGTRAEVEQAKANYQRAVFERTNAETELFTMESEFEKLTSLKPDGEIVLPDIDFDIPNGSEELIDLALKNNNKIKMVKASEKEADSELSAVKGRLSPTVNLTYQNSQKLDRNHSPVSRDGEVLERRNNNTKDKTRSRTWAIEVNMPIFSNGTGSGTTLSAIEAASQRALKATFTAEDTIADVKKECVVYWNNYVSANALIQSSRSAVKSATISSDSNLEETALGLKSNTDVWVKENQLLESKVDFTDSQRRKFVTAIKILELCGRLSKIYIIKKIDEKQLKVA